jgi:hypothetical protein
VTTARRVLILALAGAMRLLSGSRAQDMPAAD